MLRITRQTDYGVMLLTRIAQAAPGRVHTARDLSGETDVPMPTVSKILKLLARAELLTSLRGVKGGYRLSRPADEVSVADIVSAIEGPIAITECVDASTGDCDKESWCPVRSNWKTINDAVEGALEGISLASMARPLEFLGTPTVGAGGAEAVRGDDTGGSRA